MLVGLVWLTDEGGGAVGTAGYDGACKTGEEDGGADEPGGAGEADRSDEADGVSRADGTDGASRLI